MLSEERHQAIASALRHRGAVTVAALSTQLAVSEATIRRDLDTLASAGALRRVRGGATGLHGCGRPDTDLRPFADVARSATATRAATAAKQAIATRACAQIEDGAVIALDIGSTVAAMCPLLAERSLTVVTASLAVVRALANAPHIDIVILGGLLRPNHDSMVGTLTETAISQLRVDVAFLGAAGIRADGAVLDSSPSEVSIKRGLLEVAAATYLLADQQKFPGSGFLEIAPLSRFTGLITDHSPLPFNIDIAFPDGVGVEVLLP